MKARRLVEGYYKIPQMKEDLRGHITKRAGQPDLRDDSETKLQNPARILLCKPHFSSLCELLFCSDLLLVATSSSRICAQKGKISSCQLQCENLFEGSDGVTGPSLDESHCAQHSDDGPSFLAQGTECSNDNWKEKQNEKSLYLLLFFKYKAKHPVKIAEGCNGWGEIEDGT